MPFEDLLVPKRPCRTCSFLADLEDRSLAEEIVIALGKPKYSDKVLAAGMKKVETSDNLAPGRTSVSIHRERGHVA